MIESHESHSFFEHPHCMEMFEPRPTVLPKPVCIYIYISTHTAHTPYKDSG